MNMENRASSLAIRISKKNVVHVNGFHRNNYIKKT